MSDATDPPITDTDQDVADEEAGTGWDAADVMRARAAATRTDRDAAITELRAGMSDQDILDEFGINLPEIER